MKMIVSKILDIITNNDYVVEVVNDDNFFFDFHIKQCKGWLFGIRPKKTKENNVKVTFFCQYEQEINKFKPSHSEYICEIEPSSSNDSGWDFMFGEGEMLKIINFIHKHPIRAWNRDVEGIDYNVEYHTSVGLLWKYIRRQCSFITSNFIKNLLDKIMVRFVEKKIFPYLISEGFGNIRLYDNGENVFPRYDISCTFKDGTTMKGYYSLFGDDESGFSVEKQWDKKRAKLQDIAERLNLYWHDPISSCIRVNMQKGERE